MLKTASFICLHFAKVFFSITLTLAGTVISLRSLHCSTSAWPLDRWKDDFDKIEEYFVPLELLELVALRNATSYMCLHLLNALGAMLLSLDPSTKTIFASFGQPWNALLDGSLLLTAETDGWLWNLLLIQH